MLAPYLNTRTHNPDLKRRPGCRRLLAGTSLIVQQAAREDKRRGNGILPGKESWPGWPWHIAARFFPPTPLEWLLALFQGVARLDYKRSGYGSLGFAKTDSGLRW